MIRPNGPTFPVPPPVLTINSEWAYADPGITVRAHFAAMAMQGLLASDSSYNKYPAVDVAVYAVEVADALITELNKEPEAKS